MIKFRSMKKGVLPRSALLMNDAVMRNAEIIKNASRPIGEPTFQAWNSRTWIMQTARSPWMS